MRVANRTNPSPKKGLFVRSLIAVALAEALLMGSAMAAGTDAQNTPVEDSYDVKVADDKTDTDGNDAHDSASYANPTTPLFAMGTAQRSSMGVLNDVPQDPQFAVVGDRGPNNADLNNTNLPDATALAVGVSSIASGGNAVAFGLQAKAFADNSAALGNNVSTSADNPYSVAVGSEASTVGTQAVALGSQVMANADNALAVGTNNTLALGKSSIAFGDNARVRDNADNSIAMGTNAGIAGSVTNAMALGANTNVAARADRGIALGTNANVGTGAYDSMAFGAGANVVANAYGSIALGAGSIADVANVLSIGAPNAERRIINVDRGRDLTDAVNVSQLKGITDMVGAGAGIAPDGSIEQPEFTIGKYTYNTIEQALQAAASSGATDSLAVRYDLNDDGSTNFGSVTLGGPGAQPVILTNVADGKNQYDAVNFGQLSALQGEVNNLSQTVTSIGDRVTHIENNGGGGGGGGGDGGNGGGGSWNYDAQGNKITNVGDGAVSAGSKDAVNGSQLAATAQSTADALGGGATLNADGTISTPTYTVGGQQVRGVEGAVNQLDRRIDGLQSQVDGLQGQIGNTARAAYSGIAGVTALTMIPGVDVGKTFSVGAGVGSYKGYTSAALGGEARINENWKVRAGVGLSNDGNTIGVGASFQW